MSSMSARSATTTVCTLTTNILQIPADQYRFNYVKTTVRVHRYRDGTLGVFHGPRKLATYDQQGKIIAALKKKATV